MIDYFALLDQPPLPWLDPDELKNIYHAKTLQAHPDAQAKRVAEQKQPTLVSLNEAYQVLQDPKRRLHHLLNLKGCAPTSSGRAIPKQLGDFFPTVGSLSQRANRLLQDAQSTSNTLTRSLLKPRVLEMENETKELLEKLRHLYDDTLIELRSLNTPPAEEELLPRLTDLYFKIAYLSRWIDQLEEIRFQLSSQ